MKNNVDKYFNNLTKDITVENVTSITDESITLNTDDNTITINFSLDLNEYIIMKCVLFSKQHRTYSMLSANEIYALHNHGKYINVIENFVRVISDTINQYRVNLVEKKVEEYFDFL